MSGELDADLIRLLNFALSAAAAMFLWIRFNDRPSTVTRAGRVIRMAIVGAFVVGSVGSLEHYHRGSDLTVAAGAYAFVCAVLLAGLFAARHDGRR